MKRFGKVFYSIHERFIIISIFLGMCSWILESLIHSYFFDKQYSNVISHILFPGGHEVWMRLTIVVMFISFGAYAQWIVVALKKAEREVQVANMELTQIFETSADGMTKVPVDGVPKVAYGGQGGLGDVILHPEYDSNKLVYISYAEQGAFGRRGGVVTRGRFNSDATNPSLDDVEVIWRQEPKVKGSGHYSHRLAFSSDGKLFHNFW